MAILSHVVVYQCDREECSEIALTNDESTEKEFSRNWHDGLMWQFCPKHKHVEETRERREMEAQAFESMKGFTRPAGGIIDVSTRSVS